MLTGEQIARLEAFIATRERMLGIDPEVIYSVGTPNDAIELRMSDLRALLQLARAVQSAGIATITSTWHLDDIIAPDLRGQTVALVPVPVKEGE